MLGQIQVWTSHPDSGLRDLAARFLNRQPFSMLEPPESTEVMDGDYQEWESALQELIARHPKYDPAWMSCLIDNVKPKYHQPYFPEKERDEQSVKNAIRVRVEGDESIEISKLLPRLQPLTERVSTRRYYVPHELKVEARSLRNRWPR